MWEGVYPCISGHLPENHYIGWISGGGHTTKQPAKSGRPTRSGGGRVIRRAAWPQAPCVPVIRRQRLAQGTLEGTPGAAGSLLLRTRRLTAPYMSVSHDGPATP